MKARHLDIALHLSTGAMMAASTACTLFDEGKSLDVFLDIAEDQEGDSDEVKLKNELGRAAAKLAYLCCEKDMHADITGEPNLS